MCDTALCLFAPGGSEPHGYRLQLSGMLMFFSSYTSSAILSARINQPPCPLVTLVHPAVGNRAPAGYRRVDNISSPTCFVVSPPSADPEISVSLTLVTLRLVG